MKVSPFNCIGKQAGTFYSLVMREKDNNRGVANKHIK